MARRSTRIAASSQSSQEASGSQDGALDNGAATKTPKRKRRAVAATATATETATETASSDVKTKKSKTSKPAKAKAKAKAKNVEAASGADAAGGESGKVAQKRKRTARGKGAAAATGVAAAAAVIEGENAVNTGAAASGTKRRKQTSDAGGGGEVVEKGKVKPGKQKAKAKAKVKAKVRSAATTTAAATTTSTATKAAHEPLTRDEISGIVADVKRSPKYLNALVRLLASCRYGDDEEVFYAMKALRYCFDHLTALNAEFRLSRKKKAGKSSDSNADAGDDGGSDGEGDGNGGGATQQQQQRPMSAVTVWLKAKYRAYLDVLLLLLYHTEAGVRQPALATLMHFIRRPTSSTGDGGGGGGGVEFDDSLYRRVLVALLCMPAGSGGGGEALMAQFKEDYLSQHHDCALYAWRLLRQLCKTAVRAATATDGAALSVDTRLPLSALRIAESVSLEEFYEHTRVAKLWRKAYGGGGGDNGGGGGGGGVPLAVFLVNMYTLMDSVVPPLQPTQFVPDAFWVHSDNVSAALEANAIQVRALLEKQQREMFGGGGGGGILSSSSDEEDAGAASGKARGRGGKNNGLPSVVTPRTYVKAFSDFWRVFLSHPLPLPLYKDVLTHVHERHLPYLSSPYILMDFLTSCFDLGGVLALLSLKGLFTLITQHNLDYPHFFDKLYALCTPEMLAVRYRDRFLQMLDMFLSSKYLPNYTAMSFAKRLMTLALRTPTPVVLAIVPIVANIFIRHPSALSLIHYDAAAAAAAAENVASADGGKRKATAAAAAVAKPDGLAPGEYDGYSVLQLDKAAEVAKASELREYDDVTDALARTHAADTQLFECEALNVHFLGQVQRLMKAVQHEKRMPYNVDDFLQQSYHTLIAHEIKRRRRVLLKGSVHASRRVADGDGGGGGADGGEEDANARAAANLLVYNGVPVNFRAPSADGGGGLFSSNTGVFSTFKW